MWRQVRRVGGAGELEFEPLELPDWSFASNPTFCEEQVAYWGLRGDHLVPSIYHLAVARAAAADDLGSVDIGTDDAYFFPAPVWDRACARARFDAGVVGKGGVELRSDR